ncbi:MarR family winged helix-turn-helix transcriptional regulator [Burkholderia pseudomultivorans]|uniref:MarR family winged helix-turn-helix transcriptional regulator n=1 Tax=Burkholderia pseudomultivorans TaxID=1207504 RepID=UPI000754DF84|nr:MarR family transcriptional regulator [Burkholderia pseudomultivorans]KWF11638.1 MarR family transcriptional regulator [Burkholderia pseudomultivorans]
MSKTLRAENLLGVLALLIGDEMNRLDVAAAPSGQTARAMLNAIAQYPNASIELIRDAVDLSHPAAVRAIAALVEAGLVDKRPGADKRAVSLALTPAGHAEMQRLRDAREQMLSRIAGRLDAHERATLEQLLIKILWHETRDPSHSMQLCRFCDDGPCIAAGCPVECRENGEPMPSGSAS